MPWEIAESWPKPYSVYLPGSLNDISYDNHIELGNLFAAGGGADLWCMSFWIRPEALPNAYIDVIGTQSYGGSNPGFKLAQQDTGYFRGYITNSGVGTENHQWTSVNCVPLNQWTKITLGVYNGVSTKYRAFYLNDTLVNCDAMVEYLIDIYDVTSLTINQGRKFQGQISDVAIWRGIVHDTGRVSRDVLWPTRLYSQKPGGDQAPQYLWRLDQSPPSNLGKTGTHTGFLIASNHPGDDLHATIVGSSVSISSLSPYFPSFDVKVLYGKRIRQSSGYALNPDSDYLITHRVSAISIDRSIGGFNRPLSAGVCQLLIDDPTGILVQGTNDIFVQGTKVSIKATYCHSSWTIFNGFIHSQKDIRGTIGIQKSLTLHDQFGIARKGPYRTNSLGYSAPAAARDLIYIVSSDTQYPHDMEFQVDSVSNTVVGERYFTNTDLNENIHQALESLGNWYWIGDDNKGGLDEWHKATLIARPMSYGISGAEIAVTTISYFTGIEVEENSEKLINHLEVTDNTRQAISPGSAGGITDAVYVPANDFVDIYMRSYDFNTGEEFVPVVGHGTIVESYCWLTNTTTDNAGSWMDANTNVTTISRNHTTFGYRVTNTHATQFMYVTKLTTYNPTIAAKNNGNVFEYENTTSQSSYGIRRHEWDNPYLQGKDLIDNISAFVLGRFDAPIYTVRATVKNNPDLMFKANVGDHLSIVESLMNVKDQFLITNVTHEIRPDRGLEWTVTATAEKIT